MGVKTRQLASEQSEENKLNIGLLGFKMAVNEGLTVFNLVDGIVDEFHDESGTDEGEGSNDLYNSSDDYYINSTSPDGASIAGFSAGFTTTAVTEADTSTAGTNPGTGAGTFGQFTVPSGGTTATVYAWGASGSTEADPGSPEFSGGGGGGFSYGTLAVTGEQVLSVVVGESVPGAGGGGLGGGGNSCGEGGGSTGGGGGGLSGAFVAPVTSEPGLSSAPQAYIVAGAGGGSGHRSGDAPQTPAGAGGGLVGNAGGSQSEGQAPQGGPGTIPLQVGGGGTQSAGGQADPNASPASQAGSLFNGGNAGGGNGSPDTNTGGGGSGYYGGGGGAGPTPSNNPYDMRAGGGGSSYYGHPQITSGGTEEATNCESGGAASPYYVADTGEGTDSPQSSGPQVGGEDGYVLIRVDAVCASTTSTAIVSNVFAATSPVTTGRIVVFEENVATPTLNTDIIASISRDGGTTFTAATLTDSGYVTGSSGQRILTGQATISGQPAGQSMRWKLALANNTVKIHGVSLQWS